ncbi:hypothetical protein [Leptospira borgpetersenii]|uniref:hypothetical protein n=1 Tax=Leptospira borgpetersenii TaxID=174 RepID=UPI0007738E77|nr:hypothetical protein [Leptospira borgpetersenii]
MKFIRTEAINLNDIALFSSEDFVGVNMSSEDIFLFSSHISDLYSEIIEKVLSNLVREIPDFPFSQESLKVVLRRAIVPIAYFFWERVLRIQKIVAVNSNVVVYKEEYRDFIFQTSDEFSTKVQDPIYHESLIYFLSEIWDLKVIQSDSKAMNHLNIPKAIKFKNTLFVIGSGKRILNRIFISLERIIDKIGFLPKFPILTFANSEPALRFRKLYLFYFQRLSNFWIFQDCLRDDSLRRRIFQIELSPNFFKYLIRLGFSTDQIIKAWNLFFKYLSEVYPTQYLEGFSQNLNEASRLLKPNLKKYLFSSGDGDAHSTFVIAAAKEMGFKIIKAQHGGHYGYYRDNSPALEIELPSADTFLTWGWTKMHEGKQLEHIKTYPLPSPWLSERNQYWRKVKVGKTGEFDILWMPQVMKRFTGTPQGASSIRRDVISEFSQYMIDFIEKTSEKKIRVYVKPYNPMTLALLSKTYSRLSEIGGQYFARSDHFDKGLTKESLEKCSLVLWDQPGTGFLECISCGIPTLLLWNRLYCEEEEWTKDDFRQLEEVGIIHRNSKSLIEEFLRFRENPDRWMSEPVRKTVWNNFKIKYALSSENWHKDWKKFLKNLNRSV